MPVLPSRWQLPRPSLGASLDGRIEKPVGTFRGVATGEPVGAPCRVVVAKGLWRLSWGGVNGSVSASKDLKSGCHAVGVRVGGPCLLASASRFLLSLARSAACAAASATPPNDKEEPAEEGAWHAALVVRRMVKDRTTAPPTALSDRSCRRKGLSETLGEASASTGTPGASPRA